MHALTASFLQRPFAAACASSATDFVLQAQRATALPRLLPIEEASSYRHHGGRTVRRLLFEYIDAKVRRLVLKYKQEQVRRATCGTRGADPSPHLWQNRMAPERTFIREKHLTES